MTIRRVLSIIIGLLAIGFIVYGIIVPHQPSRLEYIGMALMCIDYIYISFIQKKK